MLSSVLDVLRRCMRLVGQRISWRMLWFFVFVPLLCNSVLLLLTLCSSKGLSMQTAIYVAGLGSFRVFFYPVVLLLISLILPSRVRRVYAGSVFALYAFLFTVEFILIRQQGAVYSSSIASVFLSSNLMETREFISSTVSYSDIVMPLLIVLSLAVGGYRCSRASLDRRLSRLVLILIALFLTVNAVGSQYKFYTKLTRFDFAGNMSASYIDRFIWGTATSLYEGYLVEKRLLRLQSSIVGKVGLRSPYDNLNVVLVIGESLRRDYMHCYGYRLDNTPNLDSLIALGDIVPYTDVQSPASSTVLSLLHVLTTKTVQDTGRWFNYPSLNLLLKEAGFTTAWYSNQESSGFAVQPIASIAKFSEVVRFVSPNSEEENFQREYSLYDEELLKLQDKNINRSRNRFEVFHLMGSHYTYSKRYPRHFARYKAADVLEQQGDNSKAEVVAHYLNSVLYNDYVLSLLIKEYEGEDTLLVYLSDHGEVLYDDPKRPDYLGHGGEVVPQGLKIPFLVYMSPSFRKKYPLMVDRVNSSRDRPIMTDVLTNSLCGLLGIIYDGMDSRLDCFSDNYDSSRSRVPISNDLLDENLKD